MPNPKIRFKKDDGTDYAEWENRVFSDMYESFPNKLYQIQKKEYCTIGKYQVIDQGVNYIAGYTDNEKLVCKNIPAVIFGDHTTNVKYVDKPFVIGADGVKTLVVKNAIPRYAFYLLFVNNIRPEGYKRHFSILKEKVFLTAVDLEEQKKIAVLFSELDNLISFMSDEISNLEKFKKAMMQKIFSQEIRFKKDDGMDYAEWEKIELGGLIRQHKIRNKNRLPLEIYSVNNEVGFLPQSKQFLDAGYLNCTNTSTYMIVPQNYFAYNPARINIGSIGYQNVGYDVQVSSLYVVFSTMDRLDDGYLWYWFHTKYFKKAVRHFQEGSVRFCYGYDKLEKTEICFPIDLEEQKKIADLFSAIDDAVIAAKKELEGYKNLKKYLLKQMFV